MTRNQSKFRPHTCCIFYTRKILSVLALFSCLILSGCFGEPASRYRDTKDLELPPTLVIEHNPNNSGVVSDVSVKPKSEKVSDQVRNKATNSDLNNLIILAGDDAKPSLQLKTRFDRAWDLIFHGLQLAEIEVIDQNRDTGVIKVRYVADGKGKGRGIISSMTSFFTDSFQDTEYSLTVDKDKRVTEVHANKLTTDDKEQESFNNDDSGALIKLLHKTIIADLEK